MACATVSLPDGDETPPAAVWACRRVPDIPQYGTFGRRVRALFPSGVSGGPHGRLTGAIDAAAPLRALGNFQRVVHEELDAAVLVHTIAPLPQWRLEPERIPGDPLWTKIGVRHAAAK